MKYRPEIDGLRAVAVITVILFHAGFGSFSGGYIGVDVFFVISGFLITNILMQEISQKKFSLINFYERRARRILPAIFSVMICCIPAALLLMPPSQFKDFSQSLVSVNLFSSNILFWIESGYFSAAAEEKPLLHTWSLAVEEQYYMLFPLFLLFIFRFGKKAIFSGILILLATSFALSEWGWRNFPDANFYLLPFRAWELMVGSLCVFVYGGVNKTTPLTRNILSSCGLGMIVFSIFSYNGNTPFPSSYALLPVIGTALIILFAKPETWTNRLLSIAPLVGIGLISYSAYLWHQPLFAFARISTLYEPQTQLIILLIILSFALAYLSWRFIEQPCRKPKTERLKSRKNIFVIFTLISTALILTGLFGQFSNGREKLWKATQPAKIVKTYNVIKSAKKKFTPPTEESDSCNFNSKSWAQGIEGRLLDCAEKYGAGVAIIGDSHAIDIYGALNSLPENGFLVGLTKGSCRAHSTYEAGCSYEQFADFLRENPAIFSKVIYKQAGFYLMQDENGKPVSRNMLENLSMDNMPENYVVNAKKVKSVIDYLNLLPKDIEVVWLGPRLELHIPEKFILKSGCDAQYALRPNQENLYNQLDNAVEDLIKKHSNNIDYVSEIGLMKFDITNDFMTCEKTLWHDGDHWSAKGEALFAPRLKFLLD